MPAHRPGGVPGPHDSSPSRRAVVSGLLALGAAPLLPAPAVALPRARRLVIQLTAGGVPVTTPSPTFRIWELAVKGRPLSLMFNGTWEIRGAMSVDGAALFDVDTAERLRDYPLRRRTLMSGDTFYLSASFDGEQELLEHPDPDLGVAPGQDAELPPGPA